jgi:hypothetical protein
MNRAPTRHVGEMSVMDGTGHSTLTWTADDPDRIAAAREAFDNLIRKGYSAFGSKAKTDAKHALDRFDPTMEELVMVPRTVGG